MFRQWTNTSGFACSTAHTALTFKGNKTNNKWNKQNKWAKQDNERKRSANETNLPTSTCCASLTNSLNSVNASVHWFQQADLFFLFNLLLKQKNIIAVGNKWPYKRKICSTAHTALTFKSNRTDNKWNKQNKWAKQDNERKRSANETNLLTSTCCVSLQNSLNSVNASVHWFQQSDLLFLFNSLLKQKNIIVVGNKWPYKRKICSTAHD